MEVPLSFGKSWLMLHCIPGMSASICMDADQLQVTPEDWELTAHLLKVVYNLQWSKSKRTAYHADREHHLHLHSDSLDKLTEQVVAHVANMHGPLFGGHLLAGIDKMRA